MRIHIILGSVKVSQSQRPCVEESYDAAILVIFDDLIKGHPRFDESIKLISTIHAILNDGEKVFLDVDGDIIWVEANI